MFNQLKTIPTPNENGIEGGGGSCAIFWGPHAISVSSLSDYSIWIWGIWVQCPQISVSLRKNGQEESRLLNLRRLGSSRFFWGKSAQKNYLGIPCNTFLVTPYCAIPRDYLSDTPLLRAMGFLVSQHGQLGAIPPSPLSERFPHGEHTKWRCDTPPPPPKRVSQRYWHDTLGGLCPLPSTRWPPDNGNL